jgi:hypothetical protein
MISIADMRNIATAEKEAEEKAKEAKFQKDLAMYRDKIRKVQPKVVEYIQQQIVNAMKNNWSQAGLRRYSMEKIFKDILRYPSESGMIYYFLWSLIHYMKLLLNSKLLFYYLFQQNCHIIY